ncbi:hypothetical protein [Xenorhabdus bovienii]|uniref:Uncharacterized protein n=1 Tax=Xenorhabdus bovienii TaxID=40576 RepID=A0A0B6X5Y1_XENBV|nr:hypothetical protein [Xenorhabdus bovienii]CDM88566.1 conserved protein of unknown function [Xenorhabdus bovienii]
MPFSDHDAINFTDKSTHELEYILYNHLNKRATSKNIEYLKKIGDDFKKKNQVTIITTRNEFYEYAKNHHLYSIMEDYN